MKELKVIRLVKCPKRGKLVDVDEYCEFCDHNMRPWDKIDRIVYCSYYSSKDEKGD